MPEGREDVIVPRSLRVCILGAVGHGDESMSMKSCPGIGLVRAASGSAAPDHGVSLLGPGEWVRFHEPLLLIPVHRSGQQNCVVDCGKFRSAEHW
jgi:hypothetical protein